MAVPTECQNRTEKHRISRTNVAADVRRLSLRANKKSEPPNVGCYVFWNRRQKSPDEATWKQAWRTLHSIRKRKKRAGSASSGTVTRRWPLLRLVMILTGPHCTGSVRFVA